MSSANVELIKRAYGEFAKGNIEGGLSLLHPDISVHEPDSLPYGGTYKGIEGYKQIVARLVQEWESFHLTPERWLTCR